MKNMIHFFRIAVMVIWGFQASQAAQIRTPLDAVQALGHEMSEMRHMLETYAMIGTGVVYKLPKEQLRTSLALYEATIAAIEETFPAKEIQEQIAIGRRGWAPVKKALEGALQSKPPTPEAMRKDAIFIHGNIRTVIRALEAMKKWMLTRAKFQKIHALNAAIEIDASARRLSAHYAMWMWHLPDPTIEAHWQKGVKIYTDSLRYLARSSLDLDPKFHALLVKAHTVLDAFVMMHTMAEKGHFTPALAQHRAAKASQAAMAMTAIILGTQ